MFPKKDVKTYVLGNSFLKAFVLESGNLKEIRDDIMRINTYVGNNLEPTISNIYLSVDGKFTRLIGIGSPSSFSVEEDENGTYIAYSGKFEGIEYIIIFSVIENVLFYNVKINKNPGKLVKLYYGMDVSISNIYAISNNDSYVSQYIDHKVYADNDGFVICSRQNQDRPNYLESGAFGKTIGYSVDGFDFFGLEYKETNIPKALIDGHLKNRIYQYEFAYHALESEEISLNKDLDYVFYSCYASDHQEKIEKPLYQDYVKTLFKKIKDRKNHNENIDKLDLAINYEKVISSIDFTDEEINDLFKERFFEEHDNNKLLSFFTSSKSHVVLKCKELLLERPSGNIIISQNRLPNGDYDFENVLASTGYIYGLFNSQIVIGNTSFNKLLSNQRNPLNIQKISGERIFIKHNGEYKLLTLSGIFEMGLNYLRWYYKIDGDILEFTSFTDLDSSKLEFTFNSKLNRNYEMIITNHLVMGEREHESLIHVKDEDGLIKVLFDKNSMTYGKYPNLSFKIGIDAKYSLSDDSLFYKDNKTREENILLIKVSCNKFNMFITRNEEDNKHLDFDKVKKKYLNYLDDFVDGFRIEEKNHDERIESFNYLIYWYTHDALIHYLSPHGLEQYNGAAWGTRDVCQGPAELFLSFGKYDKVRKIILDVYSHQFLETGDFPQWFMFDKFYSIQDLSSHGDIIVWPARLLALYLEETGDFSILDEKVPYTSKANGICYTNDYSIFSHLEKEIATIKENYISGTHLSCYGGGDWDDTLQPANAKLKKEMVSGWTTSLTYEMMRKLGNVLTNYNIDFALDLLSNGEMIKEDYHRYIIKDGVPAGFIHFKSINNHSVSLLLHPSDKVRKIKYRLLPLTRSIISEMFTAEEKDKALNIIDNNLVFPDGVRLMSSPVKYDGGIKTYFNRAETAANFGREIGLQYTHASIRYTEAMAKVGLGDKVLDVLSKVNPVIIRDVVKNSLPRQRNSYFSSSDGAYLNRYEAYTDFKKLKEGMIPVKGGWRVYSSGPGIYIKSLIKDMLGLKFTSDALLFDPVIDNSLGDLVLDFKIRGKKVKIKYKTNRMNRKLLVNNKEIKPNILPNPYRNGSYIIPLSILSEEENLIEIELDNPLIEKEIKGCFDYFYDTKGELGLTLDKIYTKDLEKNKRIENRSSTAAIGFALASYVIGVKRGYISYDDAKSITRKTLDTLLKVEDFHGLLPHFLESDTGNNRFSEFSTIDTAILLMGALSSGFYFKGDILKDTLYLVNRVDWDHFVRIEDGKKVINMAYSEKYWIENGGYCPACWNHYAEQLMIYYLYAIQDRTSSEMARELYLGFTRHVGKYKDYEYIHCFANALFIHQFTHAFLDFRKIEPIDKIDWFNNSYLATLANRDYCIEQKLSKTYNENSWGLSAFQGKSHYFVYGAPPFGFPGVPYIQKLEGYVAPYAALSSIVFTPKYSIQALEYFNSIPKLNGKYGLYDSYNFDKNYISDCYIGIDKGPTIIMLDNFENGTIWNLFMNNEYSIKAFNKIGFKLKNI